MVCHLMVLRRRTIGSGLVALLVFL
jgi:hypothetical protein